MVSTHHNHPPPVVYYCASLYNEGYSLGFSRILAPPPRELLQLLEIESPTKCSSCYDALTSKAIFVRPRDVTWKKHKAQTAQTALHIIGCRILCKYRHCKAMMPGWNQRRKSSLNNEERMQAIHWSSLGVVLLVLLVLASLQTLIWPSPLLGGSCESNKLEPFDASSCI